MLSNAEAAAASPTAAGAVRRFVEAAIGQRHELVLPLHGGPPLTEERTRVVQERVHQILQLIIDRGRVDGTITADVTPYDIVAFGALLAQPQHTGPEWDATCHRLLATYVAGLSAGAAAAR